MNRSILNDEQLTGVTGGAGGAAFDAAREEFDTAWDVLGMEQAGFSGIKRGEYFDKWDKGGRQTSAMSFLSRIKATESPN